MPQPGVPVEVHEQFAYAYHAAWHLTTRLNNGLVQAFAVNNLNELNTVARTDSRVRQCDNPSSWETDVASKDLARLSDCRTGTFSNVRL